MIETFLGIGLGAFLSWLITYTYFKKSSKRSKLDIEEIKYILGIFLATLKNYAQIKDNKIPEIKIEAIEETI